MCTSRHTQRARPEHTIVIRSHLFWNQLAPAGIFPPVHWLEGISVVSLKRLEMTTEAGPGEPRVHFTNDKWGFYRVTDDWFDQLNSQGPSTTCQVGDCSFCNDCVHACTQQPQLTVEGRGSEGSNVIDVEKYRRFNVANETDCNEAFFKIKMICRTKQESTFLMCCVLNQSWACGVYLPDLRRRIWSFWQSSMKPVMRFANSTTYWIAWVIWMAHCCHRASLVFRENTQRNAKQWASGFISALSSSGGAAEGSTPRSPTSSSGRGGSTSASQGTPEFSLKGCFHKPRWSELWHCLFKGPECITIAMLAFVQDRQTVAQTM